MNKRNYVLKNNQDKVNANLKNGAKGWVKSIVGIKAASLAKPSKPPTSGRKGSY